MADKRYIELVQKIGFGDEQAFSELFRHFHRRLHTFAISFLNSRDLADEVVMDVFMNVWQRRERLKSVANLETYLYVSVRNVTYNYLKREKKHISDPLEEAHVQLLRYDNTPENSIISKENLDEINGAVEALPPKCKMIFKLIREDGMSKKEVAEILGISSKTIDNQIAIAVKKIAESLRIELSGSQKQVVIQSFLFFL